ncbi:hypothetical protein K502DRAFT_299252, partial [Neoconidiobolus thromboides FSU 785]
MAGEFVKSFLVGYLMFLQFQGQAVWNILNSKFDSFSLLLIGSYLCALSTYFISSFFFYLVDIHYFTNYSQYKIQQRKKEVHKDYIKALPVVSKNFLLIAFPYSYSLYYLLHPTSPMYSSLERAKEYFSQVPTIGQFLRDIIIYLLITEVGFYYVHRLLHHPLLYAKFHKLHHEFTAPIGLAAVYATVPEFMFSNMLPLMLGPLILRSHPLTVYFWFIFAILNTVTVHSGYNLPFLRPAAGHDYHHEKFHYMFGLLGILDRFHKTDGDFNKAKK